jgi:predicted Zn-ribbon and HTH transcriptional regulator
MGNNERQQTERQHIIELLHSENLTVRDISQAVGIPEKDVYEHLAHINRSLKRSGEKLQAEPYRCLDCGFEFDKRKKFNRPGRCPQCRNSHLQQAVYWIE